jgi:hypothetical protein
VCSVVKPNKLILSYLSPGGGGCGKSTAHVLRGLSDFVHSYCITLLASSIALGFGNADSAQVMDFAPLALRMVDVKSGSG